MDIATTSNPLLDLIRVVCRSYATLLGIPAGGEPCMTVYLVYYTAVLQAVSSLVEVPEPKYTARNKGDGYELF